jgi:hypothetical protein
MTLGNPAFSVIRQHTIPKDAGLAGVYCNDEQQLFTLWKKSHGLFLVNGAAFLLRA